MTAPYAPRKPFIPVDHQLEDFENGLRVHLAHQMMTNVNQAHWMMNDAPDENAFQGLSLAVDVAFTNICENYTNVEPISGLLEHCRILIQNSVWASMNVPYPRNPTEHMDRVIDNALRVYFTTVYAHLRTEMIMANHNATVLQRTWRRSISNPDHEACRRRLLREFNEFRT
jgi:hypothetical protein